MHVLGVGRDEDKLAELRASHRRSARIATLAVDLTHDEAPKQIVDLALSNAGDTSIS